MVEGAINGHEWQWWKMWDKSGSDCSFYGI